MNKTATNWLTGLLFLSVLSGLVYGVIFGGKNFNRYQKREDARNEVLVNEIRIKQQEQLIQVEKQKAEIRVQEAVGIAKSQSIIANSLSEHYLQYLAIQAQNAMAGDGTHSVIYVPSGLNGIPLVRTINDSN